MTPTERTAALATIGWTRQELARRIGYPHGTVNRWFSGMNAPGWFDRWLVKTARKVAASPPPADAATPRPRGRPRKGPTT